MNKRILVMAAAVSMIWPAVGASAQMGGAEAAPGSSVSPATSLNALLSGPENQMMSLVRAMPADKFDFAPSAAIFVPSETTVYTDVRTFGALALHVAQANYGLGGRISATKPSVDPSTLPATKGKEAIVAALAASFEYVHQQIGTLTEKNAFDGVRGPMTKATAAAFVAVHTADEYGQMVEYARMNGLVPPASQKK